MGGYCNIQVSKGKAHEMLTLIKATPNVKVVAHDCDTVEGARAVICDLVGAKYCKGTVVYECYLNTVTEAMRLFRKAKQFIKGNIREAATWYFDEEAY